VEVALQQGELAYLDSATGKFKKATATDAGALTVGENLAASDQATVNSAGIIVRFYPTGYVDPATQTTTGAVPELFTVTEPFAASDMVVIDNTATPKSIRRATTTDTAPVQMGVGVATGDSVYIGTDGKIYKWDATANVGSSAPTATSTAVP
jgi:hypothetical protein